MSAFSNNSISRYVPSFGIGYSFFRGFLPPFFEARIFASSDPTTFGNLSTIREMSVCPKPAASSSMGHPRSG